MDDRKEVIKKTLLQVLTETQNRNAIKTRCPFCGKKLIEKQLGASFTIKCETDNCFSEDFRGL